MDLRIEGKTALVLGAGGGLGSAIAQNLAKEGVKLALGDIDRDGIARLSAEIKAAGGQSITLPWDLKDTGVIDGNVSQIEREIGEVDILIGLTGGPPPTPASGQPQNLWLDSFKSMVMSIISIADRVLPGMRRRKWGRIITSTSSGVVAPIPNLAISNALRLSLVGWSKSLAREVAKDGVTANIILPGRIATKRITFLDEQKASREGRTVEEVVRESTASIPAGRYGTPEEYADAVAFLARLRTNGAGSPGAITDVDVGGAPAPLGRRDRDCACGTVARQDAQPRRPRRFRARHLASTPWQRGPSLSE